MSNLQDCSEYTIIFIEALSTVQRKKQVLDV